MSKKYDEYSQLCTEDSMSIYLLDKKKVPMIPMKVDEKLRRELRDRFLMNMVKRCVLLNIDIAYKPNEFTDDPDRDNSIIATVKRATMLGKDITYGELLYYVDNNASELKYEKSKGINGSLGLKF